MYPRNAASPERILVGQVVLIADGTIQSSGVAITIRKQGGSELTGVGTISYGADNSVYYTPTQAETNATSFVIIASKASCFSASQTIVTTASNVSGNVVLAAQTHTGAIVPDVTLVATTTNVTNGVTASTVTDKTGYSISGTKTTLDSLNDFNAATTSVDSNLLSINGATLPVDNLELQYNTVGLTGETFPATQAQLGQITTGSGGISSLATGTVITLGNQTGSYTDTFALDGVYNSFTPSAGNIDFYYEAEIGKNAIATSVLWEGYVQANNDTLNVFAWDWVGSSWVQVDTILASNGVAPLVRTFVFTNTMTGSGADFGKVRLRFESSTVTNLSTDRVLFEYTSVAASAFVLRSGIAQGGSTNTITLDAGSSSDNASYIHSRVITTSGTGAEQESIITDYNGTTKVATVEHAWVTIPDNTTGFNITPAQVHAATQSGGYDNASVYVNAASGVVGTLIGVNGTSTNPSSNITDARTIADSQKIKKLSFSGGSSLMLDQSYENFVFDIVQGQLLDLNGQDVSGSVFMRSGITGAMSITGGARAIFELCGVLDTSLGVCNLLQNGLSGTTTLSDQDRYLFWDCFENTSATAPTIDINGNGVSPTTLELLSYEGRVILSNLSSVDIITITGNVHVTLDTSCVGGTITYSGDVKLVDNSTTSPTFVVGSIKDIDSTTTNILVDTDSTIPNLIAALNNFNPATDAVNVGRLLGTLLTETTSARLADNLSTFFDNADANTSKIVDDVGTAVSGGGEFTATEKSQIRHRLGIDGTAIVPTASPDLSQKSDISALNDFNPSTDTVANVTLVATTTDLTNGGGGGGATPAEIWSYGTRELTSGNNIVLTKGTGVTGFNDVAATDIVTGGAINTTGGSIDSVTLVDTTTTNTDMRGTNSAFLASSFIAPDNASIASILADTSTTIPNQISSLNDLSATEVWTTQLTESYAADGIAPTATQALMLTQQFLTEFDITTTSYNVKRLDGTSTAATFTLNDDANPTSITRS